MAKKHIVFLIGILLITGIKAGAQKDISFDKYHNYAEVQQILKALQQEQPENTKIHTIATSPGGKPVYVLEIGSNLKDAPALFIGANFEGNIPIATEGALRFAQMLLDSSKYTAEKKWYILPLPNPDASNDFFNSVKNGRNVNDFDINNDMDEVSGEDDFDDLNNDGWITQMRVKDLEGKYIVSEKDARIMVQADTKKGERGEYKMYTEGIDNDADGKYNEDGKGGINIAVTFPHLFPKDKKEAGLWPGQSPEVYGIMRFIYDRPEIAMVYTLGSSNFCLVPPEADRKGDADLEKIKLPGRYARYFGVEPNKIFSMNEVIEMVKEKFPEETEVTPAMVAGMLDLGPAVNPQEDDLKFYNKFSEQYREYLKSKNFSSDNLDPEPAKDGSFELWAYYHLGLPSFSMNLFSAPRIKTGEETGAIEEAKAKAKEEEEVETKEQAKEQTKGIEKEKGIKNNKESERKQELLKKQKALLEWSEKEWNGKGFVEWQKIQHPDLGEVEIGGFIPYLESTPKAERIDSLLNIQLPWLLQLSSNLSQISVAENKLTDLGAGVYKLELFIENKGYLPFPIAMGQRNSKPAPVVILLNGEMELLEGISRTPVGIIGGNQVKKFTWILKAKKGTNITAKIESAMFRDNEKQIKIGG